MGKRRETVADERPRGAAAGDGGLGLHVALCGDRPLEPGRTFALDGVSELVIGRGELLTIAPGDRPGTARLDVPDETVSGQHARLRPTGASAAMLEDLGSRNGTRVRGRRTDVANIAPGDWFVVGRTVFMLRAHVPGAGAEAESMSPASLLRTFIPTVAETFRTAAALASSPVPLLLQAQTGTGKEVLASEIHALCGRPGRLVAINCAALPETLVESELFGYRKGAFSGAAEDRPGLIRGAAGGTLLLDEIGDLPLGSQAKLLRFLQEGEVLPLGAAGPVRVDVRIIAATQRPLPELVAAGRFRADLLGRLAGYTLTLPPLRERLEDMGLLVATLLERHAGADSGRYRFTGEAGAALFEREWPLNVRELDRAIQSAVVLARESGKIAPEHLGPQAGGEAPVAAPRAAVRPPPPDDGAAEARRAELVDCLRRHHGNVSHVARELGKARMQIHRWMAQLEIDPESFRGGQGR